VKEQSHKEEMSKALRGDFERLRERGVAATLALRDEKAATPIAGEADGPLPDEAAATPIAGEPTGGSAEPQLADTPEGDVPAPSPGWLARLLGR
jgi:hypothetical protein